MLADYNPDRNSASFLDVPRYNGASPGPSTPSTPLSPVGSATGLSLMVNYIPSKFGSTLSSRKAYRNGAGQGPAVPKQGGGLAAFKSNENRIGGKDLRWTKFKWVLFFSNLLLTLYSLGAMIIILLTWFNVFEKSEIIRFGNHTELALSTTAAVLGLVTSLIGWAGILLNNRAFLAVYCLLTWITFIFIVAPGYLTFRKQNYSLEGKVNEQWSRRLGPVARMRIQSQLHCCGYFSPYVEATVTQTCYSRSVLPGCKKPYLDYQRHILGVFWKIAFSIVPAHLLVMIAALLCSNHVTYRFGKGMMPEAYRLNPDSMAVIMDQYAAQLAEQYGPEVANKVLEKSRSTMSLSTAYNSSPR
ncbi:tetraspanin Tsp2 [Coprinopsis cinerea okayama7|uniref:Tetraspanin Tsp2 n=1 Tax=Coprinopsis cinerea (strain Okayama-7 / 130 / ATCC MYA-4618 / FGSC 9003) TaxID=240176 RepID=A8N489_COPC7|nr:tetraspanin Tsp2 [Coprinopsis cinerea okayama7\|eukprot:XP_001829684.1 tetraspanin Tsp2 [Coprinopsis cinerea okayama7\